MPAADLAEHRIPGQRETLFHCSSLFQEQRESKNTLSTTFENHRHCDITNILRQAHIKNHKRRVPARSERFMATPSPTNGARRRNNNIRGLKNPPAELEGARSRGHYLSGATDPGKDRK
ncbi:Hypothetical predicted protein [Octopus vulgaris]|uniref:Uncharacterized protein n=1 Tax=Octopus vulgaris TaxID=6645 RepID=A0AA36AXY0_OCTVU|nr:Hypothetical predicted protein [Octopus vulgaris]